MITALVIFTIIALFLLAGLLALKITSKVGIKKKLVTDDFRYLAKQIMTTNEVEFFQRLVLALPDCFIFPQVAMSALLRPAETDSKKNFAAFKSIAQQRIDFAICNQQLQLICIIELDDATHQVAKDAKRDARLKVNNITVIRYQSKSSHRPTVGQLKQDIQHLISQQQMSQLLS